MGAGKIALTALCAVLLANCAIAQSQPPTIDLGWLRAVKQQTGWTVVYSSFIPASAERILPGDVIRTVDSQQTYACGPLSAARVFSRIPETVSTVTVTRYDTLKTLHFFREQETLLAMPRSLSNASMCSADQPAPILTLPGSSGQLHTVRYGPKWTLLHLWSTFCPVCWADIPLLNEISNPLPGDLALVEVAINDDAKTIEAFSLKHLVQFESLLGGTWDQGSIVENFAPSEIPTDLVIDPQGEIVFVGAGSESLRSALEFLKGVAR